MNAAQEYEEQMVLKRRHLAARNKTVLVQCGPFQSFAYIDVDGKWKDYFHNQELKGEVTAVRNP